MTKGALLLIGAAIAFCAGATDTRADDRTTTSERRQRAEPRSCPDGDRE